ncbi:sirohydrochlorin chelatase [Sphaerisporangium rhizosphaerae]|uniref:Sirohydrochlorin chelatase n=1 Tax=Sphaerisporangium rhizosphaerae TaxID=2269375 RepID=A0ABW2P2K3_9ACTN
MAHGSRDPRATATVEALLERVRLARPGLAVHAAYLDHARPSLPEVLASLDEAVVLPLLLTDAYHTRVDIPAFLREEAARRDSAPPARTRPPLVVHQGAALGPHPLLITALERRLAEAGVEIGDPETAVVLVAAGSSDHRAIAVIDEMARDWALARGWHSVTPAYASAASPTPEEAVRRLLAAHPSLSSPALGAGPRTSARHDFPARHDPPTRHDSPARHDFPARHDSPARHAPPARVVVATYLLAPGYFADKVRRTALAAGAHTVAAPLGPAPELVTVLLERHAQAQSLLRTATHVPTPG